MVDDAAVSEEGSSTLESTNEGKMRNDNNCMPAQSINMYDDFTVNSYILFCIIERTPMKKRLRKKKHVKNHVENTW